MRGVAIASLLVFIWSAPAVAAPSQQSVALSGQNLASDIALSDDDRYLAVSGKGDSGLLVWDTWSLSSGPVSASPCAPVAAVEFVAQLTTTDRFYVGCESGQVYYVDVDSSSIPPRLTVSAAIELNLGSGDVIDLAFAEGDEYVHALVLDAGYMSIHRVSVTQDTATAIVPAQVVGGTPSALAIGSSGTPLVVTRSDGYLSWIDRSGDSYATPSNVLVSFGGVLSSAAVSSEHALVFVADSGEATLWSLPLAAAAQSTAVVDDVSGAAWVELGEESGQLLAWTAGTGTLVEVYDTAGTLQQSIDLADSSAVACAVASESAATAYVAAADGTLRVLSDRPMIEGLSSSVAIVGGDEPFSVSFTSSLEGSWDLSLGGTGVQGSGSSLASGDTLAGELVSVPLTGSDLSAEGANRLFVFVTSSTGTAVDSLAVTLDEPPSAVTSVTLSAGDSRLVLEWSAGDEDDLANFTIYLSDDLFAASDESLPTLSTLTSADEVSYPLTVAAGLAAESHSLEIEGLSNGVAYYVSLKAVDSGGLEGPLSAVVSAVPEATCGAAECAGDDYGCSCSVSLVGAAGARSAGWLVAWLAVFSLVRRRRLSAR